MMITFTRRCVRLPQRLRRQWSRLTTGLSLLCCYGLVLADNLDPSTDMLKSAGAFSDVSANFGPSSNAALIVYAIEIMVGIGAYIKSKNLFSLLGLLVVVTFTAVAWALISPSQ